MKSSIKAKNDFSLMIHEYRKVFKESRANVRQLAQLKRASRRLERRLGKKAVVSE